MNMATVHGWCRLQRMYGSDDWGSIITLALKGLALGFSTIACVFYFNPLTLYLSRSFPFIPIQLWGLFAGFVGGFIALLSVCFLVTAINIWHSGLILYWKVVHRMIGMVDWSNVSQCLDLGCGSGMLLTSMASQLKKESVGGRVVGVDLWLEDGKKTMSSTLLNSAMEGVQEYVTCKTGDLRSLPFEDNHVDLVMSALRLHNLGCDLGPRSLQAARERMKGLEEIVRVLKPGGQAVLWDLCHVPEYALKLQQLSMQDVMVSECIPAFLMQSHILSFRKPT